MRHVFIINPAAGKENRTDHIAEQVRALNISEEVKLIITDGVGDAAKQARREAAVGDEVRIYACGGDGTANEVLQGIVGYNNVTLGIIPIGSGNDFVRAMDKFSREDFLSVERMVKGSERRIDLIECMGRYSMNILSVGFDCAVANNVERFKRLPLVNGSLAYKMSIIYCVFTKRKHPVRIYIDGEKFKKASKSKTTLLAVAGNGKYYGGGIMAAPKAELSDGLIDFVHASTISVPRFICLLGKYIKGKHIDNPRLPFVTFMRCKNIRFESREPIDVNLDGEIFVMNNPEINIMPSALRIIEPAVLAE